MLCCTSCTLELSHTHPFSKDTMKLYLCLSTLFFAGGDAFGEGMAVYSTVLLYCGVSVWRYIDYLVKAQNDTQFSFLDDDG